MRARPVRPEEWRRLRELRLRALTEDPEAFARSAEEERDDPDREWIEWATPSDEWCPFVAGDWDGLAFGGLREGVAFLGGMWVAPDARRQGFGRELIEAVVGWARSRGAPAGELEVAAPAAERLYESCGFVRTGASRPLPSHPELTALEMRLELPRAGR
jgi:GNAT superfamily N-acetyltransferase